MEKQKNRKLCREEKRKFFEMVSDYLNSEQLLDITNVGLDQSPKLQVNKIKANSKQLDADVSFVDRTKLSLPSAYKDPASKAQTCGRMLLMKDDELPDLVGNTDLPKLAQLSDVFNTCKKSFVSTIRKQNYDELPDLVDSDLRNEPNQPETLDCPKESSVSSKQSGCELPDLVDYDVQSRLYQSKMLNSSKQNKCESPLALKNKDLKQLCLVDEDESSKQNSMDKTDTIPNKCNVLKAANSLIDLRTNLDDSLLLLSNHGRKKKKSRKFQEAIDNLWLEDNSDSVTATEVLHNHSVDSNLLSLFDSTNGNLLCSGSKSYVTESCLKRNRRENDDMSLLSSNCKRKKKKSCKFQEAINNLWLEDNSECMTATEVLHDHSIESNLGLLFDKSNKYLLCNDTKNSATEPNLKQNRKENLQFKNAKVNKPNNRVENRTYNVNFSDTNCNSGTIKNIYQNSSKRYKHLLIVVIEMKFNC